jgi:hypothetical protein
MQNERFARRSKNAPVISVLLLLLGFSLAPVLFLLFEKLAALRLRKNF